MSDYYNQGMTAYNYIHNKMQDTLKKPSYGRYILLAFCLAFMIVGVWFPAHFMWVVWAFVAYLALNVILMVFAVSMTLVAVLLIRRLVNSGD
ncbi:hypothetical protein [uncultured Actinomyces sp.]|uniref:hypothetical protein n=1 Tax=uncultured Actinomyces sp. TaxID=249061 RepID=UPI0026076EBE|nr:hypothetical protein [uncultured Actinomyces sp.]